jgi:hypothetical protein
VRRDERALGGRVDHLAVVDDLTRVAAFQADDRPQRRGFAAAARAEQREDLAATNLQTQVVDGENRAEALRDAL